MTLAFRGSGSLARALAAVTDSADPASLRIAAWECARGGAREKYVVGTLEQLCDEAAAVPRARRHVYEIVGSWLLLNAFVDAECARDPSGADDARIAAAATELATAAVTRAGADGAWEATATLLVAHRAAKASYHIVVVARDAQGVRIGFPSAAAVGAWMGDVMRGVSAAAAELVDTAVWSSENRNFRLPLCTKARRPDSCLVPCARVVGACGADGFVVTEERVLAWAGETEDRAVLERLWVTGDTGPAVEREDVVGGVRDVASRGLRIGGSWRHLEHPAELGEMIDAVLSSVVAWWTPVLTALSPRRGAFWGYDPLFGRTYITVLHGHCSVHARTHANNHMRMTVAFDASAPVGLAVTQTCFNRSAPASGARFVMRLPEAALAADGLAGVVATAATAMDARYKIEVSGVT